ncbi:MAG TPA: IclR family transcriptional regulator [Candidatus Acidoferrales bacterium]|jgi:DNA-binding IclR family transcriptional regulator|nr:IclR family transcriptional regulator [Candidatus Acidoferrales bacterium]
MSTVKPARVKRPERTRPSPKKRGHDPHLSRAVSKALESLEILQGEGRGLALNEIARRLQLSKTSTFRLLRTLEAAGCLVSSGSGQYALGPGTHPVISTQWIARLLRAALPRLQDLSRELGETASLAALFDNRVEVIAIVESSQLIRMSNVVGHIVPPNASSLGKAIIAFLPYEQREKLLRSYGTYRFTEQSITDRTELEKEFDRVRHQKFAMDCEESVPDGYCFGVPIVTDSGQIAAALSVSLPKSRLGDQGHQEAVVAGLRAAAEQIVANLRA